MTSALMSNLVVHHLRFHCQAQSAVHFGPQAGAQIRGALWEALKDFACTDLLAQRDPRHARHCPMCRLVALETAEAPRGLNPARPFAIQPPLGEMNEGADRYYSSGQPFVFGVSLFGDAGDLFPYILQAVHRIGQIGLGYGRGHFQLLQAQAINPLTGQSQDLLAEERVIAHPLLPVTSQLIEQRAIALSGEQIKLRFLTPTQLTHDGSRLSGIPQFEIVMARLIERCQALEYFYTDQPMSQPVWREQYLKLTTAAKAVRLIDNQTRWIQARSGSRRSNVSTPLGGLVGEALYEGYLPLFIPWLLWGQSLHVGKNAVKGCGWYEVITTKQTVSTTTFA